MNPVRGGLTGLQLRRIKEFVDVRISKEIGISELASLVGLSQFHFIRAFKHSVGLSPYQYVLSERIGVVHHVLTESKSLGQGSAARGGTLNYRRISELGQTRTYLPLGVTS